MGSIQQLSTRIWKVNLSQYVQLVKTLMIMYGHGKNIQRHKVDKHISTRQVRFRKRSLPWITRDIFKLVNQRYKVLGKLRKTTETDDRSSYKTLCSRN